MRLRLYARVSTQEQQTLALQREAMVAYAAQRGGAIVLTIEEISSGAHERRQREVLMQAARRRAIDASNSRRMTKPNSHLDIPVAFS